MVDANDSYLSGICVIELADEQAEYTGRMLVGLGAEVIKVEPPGGSPTRRIGPFYEDKEDPERSLYFWHYKSPPLISFRLAVPFQGVLRRDSCVGI